MDSQKDAVSSLPYEKPRLRVISLVAEEVLSVGCKQDLGTTAKLGHSCGYNPCSLAGAS
jgi:hypothetical protein